MVDPKKVDEETFERFSGVVNDLLHELGNSLMILDGHLKVQRDRFENSNKYNEELDALEGFVDATEEMIDYAKVVSSLPEEEVVFLRSYAENHSDDFDDISTVDLGNHINRIASVSRDSLHYQRKLGGYENSENISIGELLEPLEDSHDRIGDENASSDFNYNGFEETELDADYGLRMVTWTLGKNWEEHTSKGTDGLELGFDVEETDCFYEIDVWDTGEGLYSEFPGKGKAVESRYRKASSFFNSDKVSGQGLPMTNKVAGLYDIDIFYSEEMLEDEGFGVKIKIPKY
ncbi:MAG: hypothetical protein ACI8Z7_000519 [Candidatus Nanohaloarchaea archaeon]|jgi:hypothetical protein